MTGVYFSASSTAWTSGNPVSCRIL